MEALKARIAFTAGLSSSLQVVNGAGAQGDEFVVKGTGNNSSDGHEGARYRNIVASYLHGSLLPKNPAVADHLIRAAVERRCGSFD